MTDTPIRAFHDKGRGSWVSYEDYAALKEMADKNSSDRDKYKRDAKDWIDIAIRHSEIAIAAHAERDALKAEVERLKAGSRHLLSIAEALSNRDFRAAEAIATRAILDSKT
jgi:hypothetical protein